MRISFNWLRKYIDLKDSPENVAVALTSLGLEVESIEYLGKQYDGFYIGEVVDVQKHPNADRLSVCTVRLTADGEPVQIVCGAPNVAKGQKVIVGTAGAIVPRNQHDPSAQPLKLSKTKIRSVESNGMICSEYELDLGEDKEGIKVLPADSVVGMPLADFLGLDDVAMEIGITPNRPDCLSHIGIARDLAAYYNDGIRFPEAALKENKKDQIQALASVTVENTSACPRYSARIIRNITVRESPEWLKKILTAAGQRPINNIVDITNFVMLEYGQPLHAFDFDRIARRRIIVKNSSPKEKFITLDGRTHELSGNELMICDGERAVAIAGVMGGINSEIDQSTKTVLLESAYFDPVSVRRTAKKLGISTDASYRFERGIDPNITVTASQRAAVLIAELAGGDIVSGVIDVYPKPIDGKEISLRPERVNTILGTSLSEKQIRELLVRIGITLSAAGKDHILCTVPTHRPDIEQEIDLIEEIARLFGYDNIPNVSSGEVVFSEASAVERMNTEIAGWLQANGFNEIVTNSLIDSAGASVFSSDIIKVRNPLSVELEVLRPHLLPTFLQTVAFNFNHGASQIRFFEIGSTFESTKDPKKKTYVDGIREYRKIGIVISGFSNDVAWYEKQREFDIFDLKGIVQSLLTGIGLDNIHLIYYDASSSLTEQTIGIEINGTYAGFLGRCPEKIRRKYKIEKEVFVAELDIDVLAGHREKKKFSEFSKFPTVIRDVAFIVKKDLHISDIEETIRSSGGALVTKVTLFDIFEGKSIGEGKKSVAFSLCVNSFEKTLTDSEIDGIVTKIVHAMSATHGATLRSIQ
ncbi:MAG: phenylalanine--tRNA ligase subunit beta [Bacteroidota bacterium]